MNARLKLRFGILVVAFLATLISAFTYFEENKRGLLTVAFLNIGQGDSIFIESPSGNQLLIDGGPGKEVLRELGKVMPFYDRKINAILATHPDADHIGGLNDVLDKYKADLFLEPGVKSSTKTYQNLESKVEGKENKGEIKRILARRGMIIDLGGGAELQILFPDQDVTNWETNDASIVARLVYGENEFLLTGDSPQKIERYLISLDQREAENCAGTVDTCFRLESDVLKPGHHGSKTSTAPDYVATVKPEYAVISAGKDNKYGHPNQETLDTLNKSGIKILRTDQSGTIIFKSDGENLSVKTD